jgi:hypothetical protein
MPMVGSSPQTPADCSSPGASLPAWLRLRAMDDSNAAPMKATPMRPVTSSGTSYSMVISRMTASAPIAHSAPCSR